MTTVRDLLTEASRKLQDNSDTPALEAQALLAHTLKRDRAWLFAWSEFEPDQQALACFGELVSERQHGMPIAYLTGHQEFWSLSLKVTSDTLIPRPETELLVETMLGLDLPQEARVLDLGTGSGAVALALASERPGWQVTATDCSVDALATAKANAHQLGLSNTEFLIGDWLEATNGQARFDAIVSNPPYVADNDPHLNRGDVRFEPLGALAAGGDGLAAIRTIAAQTPACLVPHGHLWLEHGAKQGPQVRELLQQAGFANVETRQDLAKLDRCTGGQLPR